MRTILTIIVGMLALSVHAQEIYTGAIAISPSVPTNSWPPASMQPKPTLAPGDSAKLSITVAQSGSYNGRNYTLHGNPIQHPPISSPPGSIIWRGTYSSLHACNAGNSPGTTTATVTAEWVETGSGGGGSGGSPSIIYGKATGIAQADIPVFNWSFDRRMQYADGTSPITYTVTGSITGRRVSMTSYTIKALVPEWTVTPDPLSSTNNRTGKITSTNSAKSKMGVYYGERELARSDDEIAFAKVDLIVPPGPGPNGGTPLPEDRQPNGGTAPTPNELDPGTIALLYHQDQTNRVATTLTLKGDPTGGSVTLDQHGLTDLKIYTNEALQQELPIPKTWTNGDTPPSTLYMVGSSSSTNLQSAQGTLDLTYKANLAASGAEYSIKDTVGVNLLPVQIEVRKKGDAVPPNGVLVKTGDVLEFVLAPQFFDTEDNFESLITWQYRQRKSDGTYEDWADFGTHGTGTKFEHTTGTGGIFQVKAVITNGGEHEYKRKKNEKMGNFEYGPGKKDQPDSIGVCDTQIQIAICREAQSFYGSEVYAGWNVLPAQHGFPEYPASGNSVIRCNIFVAHRATVAGAVVPKINGFFNEYPPLANEWAGIEDTSIWPGDPTHIAGWPILSSATYPQPGWIIAHPQPGDAGHCAITDYDGEGIGAGTSGTVNKKYLEFWDGTSRLRMYQPAP